MKIKSACEITHACGLETILEAISNIDYHCMQIFPYDEIEKELEELYNDAKNYDLNSSIYTVIDRKE